MPEAKDPVERTHLEYALRWATSGAVSTSIQGLLLVLLSLYMESVFWPSALAWVISGQISFMLHYRFTWRDRHRDLKIGLIWLRVVGWRWLKFVVVNVSAATVNGTIQAYVMENVVDFRPLAWLVALAATSPVSFLLLHYVIFKDDEPPT